MRLGVLSCLLPYRNDICTTSRKQGVNARAGFPCNKKHLLLHQSVDSMGLITTKAQAHSKHYNHLLI